jgi:hypothetical protein
VRLRLTASGSERRSGFSLLNETHGFTAMTGDQRERLRTVARRIVHQGLTLGVGSITATADDGSIRGKLMAEVPRSNDGVPRVDLANSARVTAQLAVAATYRARRKRASYFRSWGFPTKRALRAEIQIELVGHMCSVSRCTCLGDTCGGQHGAGPRYPARLRLVGDHEFYRSLGLTRRLLILVGNTWADHPTPPDRTPRSSHGRRGDIRARPADDEGEESP